MGAIAVAGVSCAVALLAACASGLVNPEAPPAGTPAFQDGYLHGCSSGFQDARREGFVTGYYKDPGRYSSEDEYRRGWDEGHRRCYEEEIRHPRMCGPGPETLSCP